MSKVIIASDIRLYREGLSIALSLDEQVEVCAISANADDVQHSIQSTSPDALLLDMAMPQAMSIIQNVVQHHPRLKIIALGVNENSESILSCAQAGVAGYVSREGSMDDLIKALTGALRDEFICSPKVAALLLHQVCELSCQQPEDSNETDQMHKLTPREREVVNLIAEGLSNKQIARRLDISVSTAKNHVHNLLDKLNARHRSEVVAMLWDSGLLRPQRPTQSP